MRTTLIIDDDVLVSIKKVAAEKGCSVSGVVSEALRSFVGSRDLRLKRRQFHMPTFDGGGKLVDSLPGEFHAMHEGAELAPFQQ